MKSKKLLIGLFSMFGMAMLSNSLFAQQNLGAACGCPTVSSRTSAAITSVGSWTTLPAAAYGKELTSGNITLTCDKIWTLDEKLYIGSGATITIQPGTVIKASDAGTNVAAARALIIERGGKIIAPGTEDCPIVFTAAADPLNGTYGVANKGKWGGVLICGKASNNLTLAANGPFIPGQGGKMAVADGLGVLEGFASSYPQDQFGVAISQSGATPAGYTALSGTQAYTSGASYTWSPNFAANRNLSGTTTLVLSANASSALAGLTGTITITGTGIATGTNATITGTSSANVTLSAAATANLSGTYTFSDGTTTLTATAASVIDNNSGATTIVISAAPIFSTLGLSISGTGIPAGTIIGGVSGTNLYLANSSTGNSVALTANGTGAITITGTYPTTTATAFQNISGSTLQGPVVFANGSGGQLVNLMSPAPASGQSFDDNDNSGVMTYVSIRHSGANLLVGSEINGLTLASVGRGTKIEHIEIVSCADDNIELFGGTVDLKYCTTLFGNDDMYDYDLGWSGRAQFLFGMKAQQAGSSTETNAISFDNDNGFECDSDDNTSNATLKSNPKIYNATIIGNAKGAGAAPNNTGSADNRGLAAINMKEAAQGTIANSVFANFKNGFNIENTLTNRGAAGQGNSFQYWSTIPQSGAALDALQGIGTTPNPSLLVKCNHFIGMANPFVIGASSLAGTTSVTTPAAATTQFGADGNVTVTGNTLAGFNYNFTINGGSNAVTQKNDVVPNPALALGSGCTQAPMDGFFEPANYRGAFSSTAGDNWLSDWSYSQVLGSTLGVQACPTDLNGDGTTDVNDFLIFAPAFGTSCN